MTFFNPKNHNKFFQEYGIYVREEPVGTNGGAGNASYTDVSFNTTYGSSGSSISLAANVFTLANGFKYLVKGFICFHTGTTGYTRFVTSPGGVVGILGSGIGVNTTNTDGGSSIIYGVVDLTSTEAGTSDYKVQAKLTGTAGAAYETGRASSLVGYKEVYSMIKIVKLVPPSWKHVVSVSGDTTLTMENEVVLVDASGGDVEITLPVTTSVSGKSYIIKKIDATANLVTIYVDGGGTIFSFDHYDIEAQYEVCQTTFLVDEYV